jgi:hypothetical protein
MFDQEDYKSPGMVVQVYNPSIRRQRQTNSKFQAILGYIARFCLKKKIAIKNFIKNGVTASETCTSQ